jgi:hypothetical protein
MSTSTFTIPPYQREYSWLEDEVSEFWEDLRNAIGQDSYFLGLVILTDEGGRKHVVDGQQRILTMTLLAAALYHEAVHLGRLALAQRIQADFIRSIDYDTDETKPRVVLSNQADNETFQELLEKGESSKARKDQASDQASLSNRMRSAYEYLHEHLREDLSQDPFKRLGTWTDFLTNHVYFAVFVHPDPASAYRVFEVINTRGRELTTADLLKNYVISQTAESEREARYLQWQSIAKQFSPTSANTLVQYIRHVVTVDAGYILPKDLFSFLADRNSTAPRRPPSPSDLMELLSSHLPLYLQMVDPASDGPAEPEALKIFSALNTLGIVSLRPILLAMAKLPGALDGMKYLLKLVVRRMVLGNLGMGSVERRFGDAARKVREANSWQLLEGELKDLNPSREDFTKQLRVRSFNKGTLGFLRRSIISKSIVPENVGNLTFILARQPSTWTGFSSEEETFWYSTLGNTVLTNLERRPKGAGTWVDFKRLVLPHAISGEWVEYLQSIDQWDAAQVDSTATKLAEAAGDVWY